MVVIHGQTVCYATVIKSQSYINFVSTARTTFYHANAKYTLVNPIDLFIVVAEEIYMNEFHYS